MMKPLMKEQISWAGEGDIENLKTALGKRGMTYLPQPKDKLKYVSLEPGKQTEFRFVSSSGDEYHMQRNEKAEPKVVVLPEGEPESKIIRRKVYAEYEGESVTHIAPRRFFFL
jgi:hypothetical protein